MVSLYYVYVTTLEPIWKMKRKNRCKYLNKARQKGERKRREKKYYIKSMS
jgi:hypothetical protein